MRVTYGVGNTIERSINEVFGADRVPVEQVIERFSGLFGYEPSRVEAHVDGSVLAAGSLVSDACLVNLVTKANTKGN